VHILVSGSSGLIGSALVPFLADRGHRVTRLVRRPPLPGEAAIGWDPARDALDPASLEGVDGVVHLAGESIATGRWTEGRKARMRESRVKSTELLARTIARIARPPRVLVCASGVGYYGDRRDEILREESAPGRGFIAELARDWEAAAEAVATAHVRVVRLRTGLVLSRKGGALAQMLPPFRLGLGGRLGGGRQYWAWIALEDMLAVIQQALTHSTLAGGVNAVSPNPATNREFTRTLARVLRRPAILPVPAFALRLLFGEMADEALLASARAVPARLMAEGFDFRYPMLEAALRHALAD
jgi:uncharacterized protein (TIGR01777 family)